jgi:hypothetical protein
VLNISLTVFVIACVLALLFLAAGRWVAIARGLVPPPVKKEGVA